MQDTKVGFVAIIRTTFDVSHAQEVVEAARARLMNAGFVLSEPAAPLTTLEAAQAAASHLSAQSLDLLIILQATFADSTLIMALAREVNAPLLLWAVPEAHTGSRLRLNSLCGVNLAGHALTRAGYTYTYVYASPEDESAVELARVQAAAGRALRRLRAARIGRVGEHPAGFETCGYDHAGLNERLGVTVRAIDLREQVFAAARSVPSTAADALRHSLAARVGGLDALDSEATRGTLQTYIALKGMADAQGLSGYAVRCWPEFFTDMGCAACGAMSMLSDEQIPSSCEADVNGTVTQLLLQYLSGEPAFGTDIVSVDDETDSLVVWHCGLAPLSMADPQSQPQVTIHSNRRLPLLMEFPLKPGRVTVARLSEATGQYRLVMGGGEIVRGHKPFSGTCGLLRFDRPARQVLDRILSEGLEHHISLTYGDQRLALLALAHMLRLPVLEL
jgi:L-fucose isomerase-like protein